MRTDPPSPPPAAPRNPVGAHVPVAGRGLVGTGLAYAERVGAEAVQVFVADPRGWAAPAGDPAKDAAFREACSVRGIPAFVHAPYLIDFGSDNDATRERSAASLRHSLLRGHAIGARGVVVHTGSAVGTGPDGGSRYAAAMAQVRADVRPLLDELDALGDHAPWLLLEPTAGQGRSLCSRLEQLAEYADALDRHPRAGVCLDTCHAFAAGHDLAAPGGVKEALDLLVAAVGEGRLRTYDAATVSDYRGERGEHYYETETRTVIENGETRTGTREVQRTRWYPTSGTVSGDFDDVPVPGTGHVSTGQLDRLAPWPLEGARPYQEEYLAGFRTVRYDIEPEDGLEAAKQRMAPVIESDCRSDIGGDEQRVRPADTRYSDLTFKLVLLPVWFLTYLHAGRSWQVMVNARSGEVIGERPYSAVKIATAAVAALAVVAMVVWLVVRN